MSEEKTTPASVSNLTQNPPRASDASKKVSKWPLDFSCGPFGGVRRSRLPSLPTARGYRLECSPRLKTAIPLPPSRHYKPLQLRYPCQSPHFFVASRRARRRSTQKAVKESQSRRLAARRAIKLVFWDISTLHRAGSSQNHIWSRCAQKRIFFQLCNTAAPRQFTCWKEKWIIGMATRCSG